MKLSRILIPTAALCAAAMLLPMCLPPPTGCVPTATRCDGQQAEVCDGANRWTVTQDCDQIAAQSGGSWTCCAIPSDAGVAPDGGPGPDHVCVPSSQCTGGAS
jgi:hypothetical protein